jgi:hypothetical protein
MTNEFTALKTKYDGKVLDLDELEEIEETADVKVTCNGSSGRNPNQDWFTATDGENEFNFYMNRY